MNALANAEVGKYLNNYFVSSFQKVGTFRVVNGQKQGGNVASYFCTSDGLVLDVVAGPVDAAVLLREARWVVETYKLALLESGGDPARFKAFFRRAHADRLRQETGLDVAALDSAAGPHPLPPQGQVHLLLTAVPAPHIENVYRVIFEKILGEQVSTTPVVETRAQAD